MSGIAGSALKNPKIDPNIPRRINNEIVSVECQGANQRCHQKYANYPPVPTNSG